MHPIARTAVPRLLKPLDQLNREGLLVVNQDALAMLAAVDGHASVATLARVHGRTRTEDGLAELLAVGAVELVPPPPAPSSGRPTDDDAVSVGRTGAEPDLRVERAEVTRPSCATPHRGSSRARTSRHRGGLGWRAAAALATATAGALLILRVAGPGVTWPRASVDDRPAAVAGAPIAESEARGDADVGSAACDDGVECRRAEAAGDEATTPSSPGARPVVPEPEVAAAAGAPPAPEPAVAATAAPGSAARVVEATSPDFHPSAPDLATPSPPSPTARAAPHILLDERFSDNRRGWPNDRQSTAWLADGAYRLSVRQPGTFVAIGVPAVPRLHDVAMTATYRKVGGPPGGGYGFIVGNQGGGPHAGVAQEGRYYVLQAGDRGEVGIWRRDGERWIDVVPWTPSPAVRPGDATNELAVRYIGEYLHFLVNGVEVISKIRAAFAAGTVGIFVGGADNEVLLERLHLEAPVLTAGPAATAGALSPPATGGASPTGAGGPAPAACRIVLGLAALRDLVGAATVGECLEDERQIPSNGDVEQRTTHGLLIFRALDRRALFVGEAQTWVARDSALVTRPNDRRFEWEGDRQLVEALRQGGHTVYFRHGPTDPGERDTDPHDLATCATQRNLTAVGREQGRAIGDALRALRIPVGRVLSSEYCRAREYARLLVEREPELEPALVLPDPLAEAQRARNTEALAGLLARVSQPGTNTVLVAHSPNIRLAAGVDLPEEGGAAIFRLEGGTPQLVARVRPGEWPSWAQMLHAAEG